MQIFLTVSVYEYTIMTCNLQHYLQHAHSPGMLKWPPISCSYPTRNHQKPPKKKALFFGSQNLAAILRVKRIPPLNIGQRGFFSIYVQHKKVAGIFPRQVGSAIFDLCFFFRCFFDLTGGSKMFFSRILVVFSAGGRFSPMFWPPAVCLSNCFPWSPAFYLWPVAPWHGRCPPPLLRDQKVTRRPPGRGIRGSASGATIPAGGKKKSPHNGLRNFEGHRAQHQMLFW